MNEHIEISAKPYFIFSLYVCTI